MSNVRPLEGIAPKQSRRKHVTSLGLSHGSARRPYGASVRVAHRRTCTFRLGFGSTTRRLQPMGEGRASHQCQSLESVRVAAVLLRCLPATALAAASGALPALAGVGLRCGTADPHLCSSLHRKRSASRHCLHNQLVFVLTLLMAGNWNLSHATG